jgi:cytochrome c-type biogenesis protein CcmH/NrfG
MKPPYTKPLGAGCKIASIFLIVAFCTVAWMPGSLADGFPGKGSSSAWGDALPHYNLANKYLNTERYEQAVEKFQDAINIYPYDPDFYTNLGVALRKLERYTDAEQAFKEATKLSPDDWVPWSDLANAYLKQNKLKETIATFQRTLKCNPPASERTAIQQDIKDITKVMSMQQGGEGANLTVQDQTGEPQMTPSGFPKEDAVKNGSAHVPSRTVPAKHTPPKTTATSKGSPQTSGGKPATATPPQSNKSMKDSGWDYIYK